MNNDATPIQNLILDELQALRSDFNINALGTAQRLSALEAQMAVVVGNGQPGRLALIEEDVEDLKGWKQQLIGVGTGVSAIGSIVVSALLWALEHLHIIHWF